MRNMCVYLPKPFVDKICPKLLVFVCVRCFSRGVKLKALTCQSTFEPRRMTACAASGSVSSGLVSVAYKLIYPQLLGKHVNNYERHKMPATQPSYLSCAYSYKTLLCVPYDAKSPLRAWLGTFLTHVKKITELLVHVFNLSIRCREMSRDDQPHAVKQCEI